MAEELRNVIVAGGTSAMGRVFVEELAKHPYGFKLAVLTRAAEGSSSKQEVLAALKVQGVEVVATSYDNVESLATALQGYDVVLSVVGKRAVAEQETLVQAAAIAKVKRFLPSEFGLDLGRVGPGVHPVYDGKLQVQKLLKAQGVPYTLVYNALFMELILERLEEAQAAGTKFSIVGSGNTPFTALAWKDIGRYLGDILLDPSTRNAAVVLTGDTATWNGALEAYNELAGGASVEAQRYPALAVRAKAAVTFDARARFPMTVGLLLDKGLGNLEGGWNTLPGKTQHTPTSLKEFLAAAVASKKS